MCALFERKKKKLVLHSPRQPRPRRAKLDHHRGNAKMRRPADLLVERMLSRKPRLKALRFENHHHKKKKKKKKKIVKSEEKKKRD